MTRNVGEKLQELGMVADRLLELNEWDKLDEEQQRANRFSSFQLSNHAAEDLRDVYGAFLRALAEFHETLAEASASMSAFEVSHWRQLGQKIETSVRQLGVSERFIRP